MKKLIIAFAALAAAFLTGCTATKVEYSRNNEGEVKYKIEHNGHWLKTEAESMGGGMSQDGQFNIELAGLKSSPSEEFNKVMKTYTSAVVTLAQIAAAAYNPSASTASQSVNAGQGASTAITVNTAQTDAAKAATANATQAETAQTESATCDGGNCTYTPTATTDATAK